MPCQASAARGKSNQQAVFLDTTGRAYSLSAHSLPSARGQGEPLSGRLNPAEGASFRGVMIGDSESRWLVASDAGYGFFVQLGLVHTRNRAGKALLKVRFGGTVVIPVLFESSDFPGEANIAALNSSGRLLIFPASELPELARGKGNKLMGIPKAKLESGEEYLQAIAVLQPGQGLRVVSGQRVMTLKPADLEHFEGSRGRRGNCLPRGWRKVDQLLVWSKDRE